MLYRPTHRALHWLIAASIMFPSIAPRPAQAAPWTLSARAGAAELLPAASPADPQPAFDLDVQPLEAIAFAPQAETLTLLGAAGGVAQGFGGRVRLQVSEGAVEESLEWRVRTPGSDRVDVTLTPTFDRYDCTDLKVLKMEVHQCFGTWAGRVVGDGGEVAELRGIRGFAEEARNRW